MRVGAQWTDCYITADLGAILIILSALGLRRLQRGSGVRFGRAVGL